MEESTVVRVADLNLAANIKTRDQKFYYATIPTNVQNLSGLSEDRVQPRNGLTIVKRD